MQAFFKIWRFGGSFVPLQRISGRIWAAPPAEYQVPANLKYTSYG